MHVIPRLAKHAEGPLARSIAFANLAGGYVSAAFFLACVTRLATVRSLAVFAARHDSERLLQQSRDFLARQCQDAFLLGSVIQRAKSADLFETAHRIEGVEKLGVARGQLG